MNSADRGRHGSAWQLAPTQQQGLQIFTVCKATRIKRRVSLPAVISLPCPIPFGCEWQKIITTLMEITEHFTPPVRLLALCPWAATAKNTNPSHFCTVVVIRKGGEREEKKHPKNFRVDSYHLISFCVINSSCTMAMHPLNPWDALHEINQCCKQLMRTTPW